MNKIIIIGNLVRDPEITKTQSGVAVCKFTVAVNNGKDKDGNDRPADYINCTAWDKRGETIGRFFSKGKPICVTGAFKTDVYDSKKHEGEKVYNSYVLVNEFEFIGSKGDGGAKTEAQATPTQTETPAETETTSEDIPF